MNTTRLTAIASLVLLFGGIMALGAGAGLRMAVGLATQTLDCAPVGPTFATIETPETVDCVPLVRVYQQKMQTMLLGGGVATACGLLGTWSVRRRGELPPAAAGATAPADGPRNDAE